MKRLTLKSYDFLIESNLERIKLGKVFDQNLKPYDKEFLENMLQYLEERERFEECLIVSSLIKSRFNHDENYIWDGKA